MTQTAAFDVIGIFGFSKDFRATLDLHGEGAQACKCLSEGKRLTSSQQPAALRACRKLSAKAAWKCVTSQLSAHDCNLGAISLAGKH